MLWSQRISIDRTPVRQVSSSQPSTQDDKLSRTVKDTAWHYKLLDQKAETTLSPKVTLDPSEQGELLISGRGCNEMSAIVSTTKPDSYVKERTIADKTYYLYDIISTAMACVDERSGHDQLVGDEIKAVFDSLSR